VVKTHYGKTWLDYLLFDGLTQTAGMYVNLMTDNATVTERGIFMCETIDRWLRSPKIRTHESLPTNWEVYTIHHPISDKKYISDIFAFDALDGSLVEVVLGASYNRVPLSVMRGILGSQAPTKESGPAVVNGEIPSHTQFESQQQVNFKPLNPLPALTNGHTLPEKPKKATKAKATKKAAKKLSRRADSETLTKTRSILENLTGIEASSINAPSSCRGRMSYRSQSSAMPLKNSDAQLQLQQPAQSSSASNISQDTKRLLTTCTERWRRTLAWLRLTARKSLARPLLVLATRPRQCWRIFFETDLHKMQNSNL
jgi:hypothetical protein